MNPVLMLERHSHSRLIVAIAELHSLPCVCIIRHNKQYVYAAQRPIRAYYHAVLLDAFQTSTMV